MQLIGLIGGLSWESTAEYYRILNQGAQARLGGVHSARSLIYSFDFGEIEALQNSGKWDAAEAAMVDAARRLERGGADFLVICSNTMHRMAGAIEAAVKPPLLHIADPTGAAIKAAGLKRIGLLGTGFTMEQPFYRQRLIDKFGLDVRVPDAAGRKVVHDIIYRELVKGIVRDEARAAYRDVMARLVADGAEGIILGCTEIMLLVGEKDSTVPLFDTTTIHAEAALQRALQQ
ncbi:aspartate/glutamate racemase family protein [Dongia rigui]|uniref:Aspartate/glutamate racemase family protein n=1 Tax=Dongia rigui TaxID=940149 RepID=A0ABU5DVV8_9PROT|nr:aspartate/glutamate racemase family protein [Dongia rigui]MDY0871451.1 aspartate/glutamate racemase family protein [Dongia rigui]